MSGKCHKRSWRESAGALPSAAFGQSQLVLPSRSGGRCLDCNGGSGEAFTYLLKAACKPFWSFTSFCNSSMRRMRAFRADKSSAMTAPASTSVLPPPSKP